MHIVYSLVEDMEAGINEGLVFVALQTHRTPLVRVCGVAGRLPLDCSLLGILEPFHHLAIEMQVGVVSARN